MRAIWLGCLVSFFVVTRVFSASELRVRHEARSVQPGEILLFHVEADSPLKEVEAGAFDKSFPFFAGAEPLEWKGLVGIDLETDPGEHQVEIRAVTASGKNLERNYAVLVEKKEFPVRHLTVDEKFVSPPDHEMNRIRRESKRVANLFMKKTPERLWRGSFISPVTGAASSSFGKRSVFNGKPRSPHTGTDFSAATGTPVNAPNAGRVVLAQNLYFAGNTVMIDHGMGLYSYLAHLSEFAVREGDLVEKGELVGRAGATGRVTAPHLHWTLRLAQSRVDPLSLISISKSLTRIVDETQSH